MANKKIIYVSLVLLVIIVGGIFAFRATPTDAPAEGIVSEEDVDKQLPPLALEDTAWIWMYSQLPDNRRVDAPAGEKFELTLHSDNTVDSTTDCNAIHSTYIRDEEVLSFAPFAATKMFCQESMESEYVRQLGLTTSHVIEGDMLHLILNRDAGIMVFVAKEITE